MPIRLVPRDLITMNTRFILVTGKKETIKLQLVYPLDADKAGGRILILSWLGLSLLGRREGDSIRMGLSVQRILYQPEANDDFHL